MKTLHHDRYWSAHPRENYRFLEMYEKESENHAEYHDNLFCQNHEETVEFMQDVDVPWIAFKVLAAGAIPPEDGITYAFQSGADFVCLGMFDFQVREDVQLIQKAVAEAQPLISLRPRTVRCRADLCRRSTSVCRRTRRARHSLL